MATRLSRAERCRIGRHTPAPSSQHIAGGDGAVRRAVCCYCGRPIMRTEATRIWFLATALA